MSMLVEGAEASSPDEVNERGCSAPAFVDDKRYPPRSLKYVYFLHNHPAVPTNLSEKDLQAIARIRKIHGTHAETKEGRIPIGIVAFFSESSGASNSARCDGFFEYNFGSEAVVKWSLSGQGAWRQEKVGTVTWLGESEFRFEGVR